MPQVLDSFFCFTLHTGTTLLGWLGFSSAVLSIINGSMSFKKIDEWIIDITNKTNSTEDISPAEMDIFRTGKLLISTLPSFNLKLFLIVF